MMKHALLKIHLYVLETCKIIDNSFLIQYRDCNLFHSLLLRCNNTLKNKHNSFELEWIFSNYVHQKVLCVCECCYKALWLHFNTLWINNSLDCCPYTRYSCDKTKKTQNEKNNDSRYAFQTCYFVMIFLVLDSWCFCKN